MPKIVKPLSDKEIKNAKSKDKDYKLSDGQSLYLLIQKNGTKFFRFDYKFENKRKSMSFGTYPTTSLQKARQLREDSRKLLREGLDPIREKNKTENDNLFKTIAEEWLIKMEKEWESTTSKKVINQIKNHVYPYIGNISIEKISITDILKLVDRMNQKGLHGTAKKNLSTINRIYKYAVTYNYCSHNIIADIDQKNILISTSNNHFNAITDEVELKVLMKDINYFQELYRADISTIFALKLAPYVILRPFNLRHLEWEEINFEESYIHIPASKMKTKKEFILPISTQAIKIIKAIKPYSFEKSKYIFPSPISNLKCISDATLNHALFKLGYKNRHTSHSFRSSFSTISHEKIKEHKFSSDIIESCLAHAERNKIKAAYNRESKMKYFDEKKELLQWYSDWLNSLLK